MESLSAEVKQLILTYSENNELNCKDLNKWQLQMIQLIEFIKNSDNDWLGFTEHFQQFINDNVVSSMEGHRDFAVLGIICFNLFVQANWTGPPVDVDKIGPLAELVLSTELNKKSVDFLESNGDEIYQLITYPVLLLIAYMILVECSSKLNLFLTLPIWSVKCLSVYCHVIDEIKESHLSSFQSIFDKVEQGSEIKQTTSTDVIAEYYMCCFHLYLKCYNYAKAKECLDHVKTLLQIEISLTSSLGKRTKFQEKELPQLKLNVKTGDSRGNNHTNGIDVKDFPIDVELDNDTLLPHIKFVDRDNMKDANLSPLDQACILCNCVYIHKTSPRDKLIYEQMSPFIEAVLSSPQSWSIQLKSLLLRSVTEMSSSRKMERALMQLESLVQSFNKTSPPFPERHLFTQAIDLNPQWANEKTHAQLCFTIGYVDTALEVFLRLQLWDDVISCYQRLGRHGKAEEVIREQLKVRESATLWCLLGDVTLDKQYYHKAWEFSGKRSSRSQRSLGQWHLRRQEFSEAIPYLQKSLDLNCLQPGIAFSLGCSCMSINEIQGAAKALQLCVSLEPENPEAWSNLATNYIRLNQIEKAYKALKEATRLSYDNWKIWENYLLVATDLGQFEDTILICHRLIDLNRKSIDVEVLQILTRAVLEDIPNSRGVKSNYLKPKLFKLFGHITSLITSDPMIWELYAEVCLSEEKCERKEQGLQYLYKSFRCYNQNTVWGNNEGEVKNVMRVALKTVHVTKSICMQSDLKEKALTLSTTTKMALSNLLTRLQKAYCGDDGKTLPFVEPHVIRLGENIREMQLLVESC